MLYSTNRKTTREKFWLRQLASLENLFSYLVFASILCSLYEFKYINLYYSEVGTLHVMSFVMC